MELALGQQMAPGGSVVLTRDEAELVLRTLNSIVEFSQSYPLEYQSYCPPERWDGVLRAAGAAEANLERQLTQGSQLVSVQRASLLAILDLEECVSATRDLRIKNGETALAIAGIGALAAHVLALPAVGIVSAIVAVGFLVVNPLRALATNGNEDAEPFKVSVALGDHSSPGKVVERVLVADPALEQRHHWGVVRPRAGAAPGPERAWCLARGNARVRVEGWDGSAVELAAGWRLADPRDCDGRPEIAVWQPCDAPRSTAHGRPPTSSGHDEDYWVDYVGPLTEGECRRAGPFG